MGIGSGQANADSSNTPEIVTVEGDVLEANESRRAFSIQNVGQGTIFIRLGTGASSTVFHYVLKPGTADSDGLGGTLILDGVGMYAGVVSIAGTTPKAVIMEI